MTTGLFRFVRNPILTATAVTAFGIAHIVPNALAALMLVAFVAAHQIQVRFAEEPYLRAVHGDQYRTYTARIGHFLRGSTGFRRAGGGHQHARGNDLA